MSLSTKPAAGIAAIQPLAEIIPFIDRGNVSHYRHLATTANESTLRTLVLLMAEDLDYLNGVEIPESG